MLVATDDALGLGRIDVRIVEQAEFEFPEQHGRDQLVELRFFQDALLHQLDEMQIAIRVGQLDVDARFDGEPAGFLLVLRDEVAVRVGPVAEFPDREVVGDGESL